MHTTGGQVSNLDSGSDDIITQIVPSVGDAVTEAIGSSPRITAFFLELVTVASCRGGSLAL